MKGYKWLKMDVHTQYVCREMFIRVHIHAKCTFLLCTANIHAHKVTNSSTNVIGPVQSVIIRLRQYFGRAYGREIPSLQFHEIQEKRQLLGN